MRIYKNLKYESDLKIIHLMQSLSKPQISVADYRDTFFEIGKALGKVLNDCSQDNYGNTMLACASEDADWLVDGVLKTLSRKDISLAVFWNERITLDETSGLEYSPIIKSYIEPITDCKTLILVKSIISTSCVVKTQITRLVNKIQPEKIYIIAPVMYKDAESSLRKEFPPEISNKFNFITFAVDSTRDSQNTIIPGIGGMIYSKLGLGDAHAKNKYIPNLVKERMETN